MKLSFLIYKYFPYGGQQRDLFKIILSCLDRGHKVEVYTLNWQGDVPQGVEVKIVPVKALSRIKLYQRFTTWVLAKLALQSDRIVIGFNKMPGLDFYFAADPCFAEKADTQRGVYYKFTSRYRHFKKYEEVVFNSRARTEILLLSPLQRNAFLKYYPDCSDRLHDVPPGISRDRMVNSNRQKDRDQFREEFSLSADKLLVLQVGSGFRIKGVDRSIRAIAALPNELRRKVKFMLVGQDKPGQFKALARKLGIEKQFSVFPGRDDIPRFLAGADLLLHPAYSESAGYILLEATIAGLPVLTTATCGYAFHINVAGSGEVCDEPFDQLELNQRLSAMLSGLKFSSWSQSGRKYGANEELYALGEKATDIIETKAQIQHELVTALSMSSRRSSS
jgi:UDP-glucose:(heptosyl)LPS alpha-1,3-glucosyltransferase